ncbi:MAG TPA: ABC transporter ATP-binding protein [Stellaceae bacterium]|nr:ABC transporter ATP-binding protein [Stellaceae bacterium]
MIEALVEVRDLTVRFAGADGPIAALNGIDFGVAAGEAMTILGESGSGKSVTLRALMRLLPTHRTTVSGIIRIGEHRMDQLGERTLAELRGTVVSMIFQEPMLAFDPVYTVGRQIIETIIRHEGTEETTARARARELLERVQIPSAERRLGNYPHEMSGGMRQRAMIALALACRPALLLADEPTTALDATVQIEILLLLRELQRELGMTMIFVTHDIGVATEIADSLAVMYAGRIVEHGPVRAVLHDPAHPYTRGLLASTLHRGMRGRRLEPIPGAPPSLANLPPGCSFAPRCALAAPACIEAVPSVKQLGSGHTSRCLLAAPRLAGAA